MKVKQLIFGAVALVFSSYSAPSADAREVECFKCLVGRCQSFGPLNPPLYKTCLDFGSFCVVDDGCDETLAGLKIGSSGAVLAAVVHQELTEDGVLQLRNCSGALISVRKDQDALNAELARLAKIVM